MHSLIVLLPTACRGVGVPCVAWSGTPRGHHRALLENFVALKADARALGEENERLRVELGEVQHARGAVTTVPVPGAACFTVPPLPLPSA